MEKSATDLYTGYNEGYKDFPQGVTWKKALEFAKKKHEGQLRDEGVPYFEHIRAVMEILIHEANTFDDTILTIAALHDVIEDTDCTYGEVAKEFGENIADAVNLLTRKPNQSFDEYAKAIFESNEFPYARKIKLADRLHNLRTLPNTKKPEKILKKVLETERCILPYENCSPRDLMLKIKEELASLRKRPEFSSKNNLGLGEFYGTNNSNNSDRTTFIR